MGKFETTEMFIFDFLVPPCTHTTLFQRLYSVHNVGTTSYERLNDIVCVLVNL